MKNNLLPITLAALGSLVLAVSASGQFIDVTIEPFDSGAPAGFVTYRVVAHFGGQDIVLAWGAIPGEAELIFFTSGGDLLNAGGGFGGLKQEDFAQWPISALYDSWLTVGTTGFAGNQTDYTPGFIGSDGVTNAVKGNAFSETDGLVFDSDPTSPIVGPDVVLAQFTLPEPGYFHLEAVVAWRPPGGTFQLDSFEVDFIPGPGALALFGLAGLVGSRRRRFTHKASSTA